MGGEIFMEKNVKQIVEGIIKDVEVKNPNNPAQLVPCKLITFEV